MKTRKAATPKSSTPKKTSPNTNPATEAMPHSLEIGPESAVSASGTKKPVVVNPKLIKNVGISDKTGSGSKPSPPEGGVLKESSSPAQALSGKKVQSVKKVVKKIVKKEKNISPTNTNSTTTPNKPENDKKLLEEAYNAEGETTGNETRFKYEALTSEVGKSDSKKTSPVISEKAIKIEGEKSIKKEGISTKNELDSTNKNTISVEVSQSPSTTTNINADEKPVIDEKFQKSEDVGRTDITAAEDADHMEECDVDNDSDPKNTQMEREDTEPEEEYYNEESLEEHPSPAIVAENSGGDLIENTVIQAAENDERLEEDENIDFTAHANARKRIKELEIFIGGLDRNAFEDDVKNAFDSIGDVVEVRMRRDSTTNKNKGYAFVKFATKEKAAQALSEMKNPVICGKRCGTAPSEDNDTLFLGNICNTWTKEAIKQKLKDYGIEEVVNVTLVSDACYEGLSRGFAFVEFSCHAEAIRAFKRLQKPDIIFGHPERTAKVAFAEPLREPDPEVMAQVKSVFIDGIPPHWDEDRVREQFRCYGEVGKVMLARNMLTAKRKDFGFVDFDSHEAAILCIDAIHNTEIVDGDSKLKVKARLSNPLPKTQAVKGGMCGGYRIGHGGAVPSHYGGGTSSHHGRETGGRGRGFNRGGSQRGRGFNPRGKSQFGRSDFENEQDFYDPSEEFNPHQNFGRGGRRGAAGRQRHNMGRRSHGATTVSGGRYFSSRRPFSSDDVADRYFERTYSDLYHGEDTPRGLKRPIYSTEPAYPEASRFRTRLDYSDSRFSSQHMDYQDAFGDPDGLYSHDYYGTEYGTVYSSSYGPDRLYRDGRY